MANEVIRIHEQFYSMHVFPPVYAGSDEMGVGAGSMARVGGKRW